MPLLLPLLRIRVCSVCGIACSTSHPTSRIKHPMAFFSTAPPLQRFVSKLGFVSFRLVLGVRQFLASGCVNLDKSSLVVCCLAVRPLFRRRTRLKYR